jgi:hypothetical protein
MNPAIAGIVISGLAALGTVIGVFISGVGKRGDRQAQEVNDQFKRQLDEINYLDKSVHAARDELGHCHALLLTLLPPDHPDLPPRPRPSDSDPDTR